MLPALYRRRKILAVLPLVILAGALLSSCGTVRKATRSVRKVLEVSTRMDRLDTGDTTQVLHLARLAVGEMKSCKVVHQDELSLVAQVKLIPGLGLRIPTLGGKRYYLRIDLKPAGQDTKVVLHFFRSPKGNYTVRDKPNNFIKRGASKLFANVFDALLQAGVVIK